LTIDEATEIAALLTNTPANTTVSSTHAISAAHTSSTTTIYTAKASTYKDCAAIRAEASKYCEGLPYFDPKTSTSPHGDCLTGFNTKADLCVKAVDEKKVPFEFVYEYQGAVGENKQETSGSGGAGGELYKPVFDEKTKTGSIEAKLKTYEDCAYLRSKAGAFCDGLPEFDSKSGSSPHGDCLTGFNEVADACVLAVNKKEVPFNFKFKFIADVDSSKFGVVQLKSDNQPALQSTLKASYAPEFNAETQTGTIKTEARTYEDCAYLRSQSHEFCDGLPAYDAASNTSPHGECLTGFSEVADLCVLAVDKKNVPFEFKFSFTAPKSTADHNTSGLKAPSADAAHAVEAKVGYKTEFNADTKTGTASAQASTYEECAYIRGQSDEFCDGLPFYDSATKTSPHGECLTGFSAVADQCVYAVDKKDKLPFKFVFEFKVGGASSSNVKTVQAQNSHGSSSGGDLYAPVFDENTLVGKLESKASSYEDCAYLRSKAGDFCDGLPAYDGKSGASPHGDCLTGYNKVADACVLAVDKKEVPFKFVFEFKAPASIASHNTSGLKAPSADAAHSIEAKVGYKTDFNADTKTGTASAQASTYEECAYIRGQSDEFCDGLPFYDSATKTSPHGECLTGFSAVADQCVYAVDKKDKLPFKFVFEFKVGGASSSNVKTVQAQNSHGSSSGGDLYAPVFDENTLIGKLESKASSYEDCAYLRSKAGDFCDGLPAYDGKSGASPHGDCLTGYNKVADACVSAVDKKEVPYKFVFEFKAPASTAGHNTSGLKAPSADAAHSIEAKVGYKTDFNADTKTGTASAQASTYEECAYIRGQSDEFCDGLPFYDSATKTSPHGECLTGFSAVADQCVYAVDKKDKLPFKFVFEFKVGGASSSNVKTVQAQNSHGSSSGGDLYAPVFDENTLVGKLESKASSYEDCAYLRSKAGDFCDGLPAYDGKSGASPHGDCLTGYNKVADACVSAVDKKEVPYKFVFEFKAPASSDASKHAETTTTGGSGELYVPVFDPTTKTGHIETQAKTYQDCAELRSHGRDFCNGLPYYDPATSKSPHGDCLTGFSDVADLCVKAVDEGKVPFKFYFEFTDAAHGTTSSTTAVVVPNSTGIFKAVAHSAEDCQTLGKLYKSNPDKKDGFCDLLEGDLNDGGVTLKGKCGKVFDAAVSKCVDYFKQNSGAKEYTLEVKFE
jgi:hypothetical protein